jgi:hypothetical protein
MSLSGVGCAGSSGCEQPKVRRILARREQLAMFRAVNMVLSSFEDERSGFRDEGCFAERGGCVK